MMGVAGPALWDSLPAEGGGEQNLASGGGGSSVYAVGEGASVPLKGKMLGCLFWRYSVCPLEVFRPYLGKPRWQAGFLESTSCSYVVTQWPPFSDHLCTLYHHTGFLRVSEIL